jgi:hypothetical protein
VAVYCPATDDKNAAEAKSAKDNISKDTTGDAGRTGNGSTEERSSEKGSGGTTNTTYRTHYPLPFIVQVRARTKERRTSAFLATPWQVQTKGILVGAVVEIVDRTPNRDPKGRFHRIYAQRS